MLETKLKQLAAEKAKLIALERQIESERAKELASLPSKYGFTSVNEFATAVLQATSKKKHKSQARRPRPKSVSKPAVKQRSQAVEAPSKKQPVVAKAAESESKAA